MRFIPCVLLTLLLLSCADDEYPVRLESSQVVRLLTQNNSKAWLIQNAENCAADDILTFSKAVDAKSLGTYIKAKGEVYCDGQSEEDILGTWEVTNTADANQLKMYGEDTITYEIVLITASTLHLRTAEGDFNYRTPNH